MTLTLTKTADQYLVKQAVTWEQFKALQSAFAEIGGVRLNYCEGVVEIVGIGLLHEMVSTLLGALLNYYFLVKRIRFTGTGAYTQTIEPKLEFQADLSFAFGDNPELTDLCIEIVVTSGSVKKLRKYQLRNIPEVWLIDVNQEVIEVYRNPLQGVYQDIQKLVKNQTLSILAFPDVSINVTEIF